MVPDSSLNKAFFLGQTQSQTGSNNYTIEVFDLTHFTPLDSVTIPNVSGNPLRLIRWGANGLAFNTTGGQLILISGSFAASTASQPSLGHVLSNHVQMTWRPRRPAPPPDSKN